MNEKYENICFSSELNDEKINDFFLNKFNHYDFNKDIKKIINNKNKFFFSKMIFLGSNLFDAVNKSTEIVSPEGIITHMGYFLQKPILALMHFKLKDKRDFINQIISCNFL